MTPREANDLRNFEGNAQGLRVLTSVENHINSGGMRLTYATLSSFIKYPWTSLPAQDGQRPKRNKYGVYTTELEVFHEISKAVGLLNKEGDDWYSRHPLVHLMESADDFCYGILDLEDGLEMGIISWEQMYDILKPVLPEESVTDLENEMSKLSVGRKTPILRGKIIGSYVEAASEAFIKQEDKYLSGDPTALIDLCEDNIKNSINLAKRTAKEKIFVHPRKIELEVGSYNVIATLLSVMCESVCEWVNTPQKMSFRSKRIIDLIGEDTFDPRITTGESDLSKDYLALRRVIDYISGMTDNYATFLAKQFNGMGI